MDSTLESIARGQILSGLKELPESWVFKFKRMYSPHDLEANIESVVEKMAPELLDWALTQVESSLKKYRAQLVHGV